MSGNYMLWLVLGGAVLFTLYYKGYISVDGGKVKLSNKCPDCGPSCDCEDCKAKHYPPTTQTAQELGVLYHKALKAEAEAEMFERMAKDRSDLIKERLTAPFSPPDPAGPNHAGAPPAA